MVCAVCDISLYNTTQYGVCHVWHLMIRHDPVWCVPCVTSHDTTQHSMVCAVCDISWCDTTQYGVCRVWHLMIQHNTVWCVPCVTSHDTTQHSMVCAVCDISWYDTTQYGVCRVWHLMMPHHVMQVDTWKLYIFRQSHPTNCPLWPQHVGSKHPVCLNCLECWKLLAH